MSDLKVVAEPGRQDILITRTFDAPRDLVWRALTEPELIGRWFGLDSTSTDVGDTEVRTGTPWRLVEKAENGESYAFHGVHHDVLEPERIVRTFEFEGVPGHVSLETLTLTEEDGRTGYRVVTLFPSVEDRDGMIASGMESGMAQSLDSLERVARSLR
ncbi:SRPBCC family protein [Nocardiopsis sp. MG754419]|uniref:SRPBCC family protein n=1 Tax=Nocardiopsis sp. MG754419 TaxID=2259865 RepID=UPI001BA587D0|nr:SRPBCC family protein [Nocardiopsis sp. MG754419]MBR8740296.1 ATPase [Nocardiopsis sp. MG754419]